jgi:hypothetical protein
VQYFIQKCTTLFKHHTCAGYVRRVTHDEIADAIG